MTIYTKKIANGYGNNNHKAISAIADAVGATLAHNTGFHPDYAEDIPGICVTVDCTADHEISIQLPRYRSVPVLTDALTSNNQSLARNFQPNPKFYEDLGRCFAMSYFLEDVDGTTANTLLMVDNFENWVGCRRFDYGCAFASLQSGVQVISARNTHLTNQEITLPHDVKNIHGIIFYYISVLLTGANIGVFHSETIRDFQSLLHETKNHDQIQQGFFDQLQSIVNYFGDGTDILGTMVRKNHLKLPEHQVFSAELITKINNFLDRQLNNARQVLANGEAGPSNQNGITAAFGIDPSEDGRPLPYARAALCNSPVITELDAEVVAQPYSIQGNGDNQEEEPVVVNAQALGLFAQSGAKPYLLAGASCLALGATVLALSMTGLLPAVLVGAALAVLVIKIAAAVLMAVGGVSLAVGVKRLCL